eukprot:403341883
MNQILLDKSALSDILNSPNLSRNGQMPSYLLSPASRSGRQGILKQNNNTISPNQQQFTVLSNPQQNQQFPVFENNRTKSFNFNNNKIVQSLKSIKISKKKVRLNRMGEANFLSAEKFIKCKMSKGGIKQQKEIIKDCQLRNKIVDKKIQKFLKNRDNDNQNEHQNSNLGQTNNSFLSHFSKSSISSFSELSYHGDIRELIKQQLKDQIQEEFDKTAHPALTPQNKTKTLNDSQLNHSPVFCAEDQQSFNQSRSLIQSVKQTQVLKQLKNFITNDLEIKKKVHSYQKDDKIFSFKLPEQKDSAQSILQELQSQQQIQESKKQQGVTQTQEEKQTLKNLFSIALKQKLQGKIENNLPVQQTENLLNRQNSRISIRLGNINTQLSPQSLDPSQLLQPTSVKIDSNNSPSNTIVVEYLCPSPQKSAQIPKSPSVTHKKLLNQNTLQRYQTKAPENFTDLQKKQLKNSQKIFNFENSSYLSQKLQNDTEQDVINDKDRNDSIQSPKIQADNKNGKKMLSSLSNLIQAKIVSQQIKNQKIAARDFETSTQNSRNQPSQEPSFDLQYSNSIKKNSKIKFKEKASKFKPPTGLLKQITQRSKQSHANQIDQRKTKLTFKGLQDGQNILAEDSMESGSEYENTFLNLSLNSKIKKQEKFEQQSEQIIEKKVDNIIEEMFKEPNTVKNNNSDEISIQRGLSKQKKQISKLNLQNLDTLQVPESNRQNAQVYSVIGLPSSENLDFTNRLVSLIQQNIDRNKAQNPIISPFYQLKQPQQQKPVSNRQNFQIQNNLTINNSQRQNSNRNANLENIHLNQQYYQGQGGSPGFGQVINNHRGHENESVMKSNYDREYEEWSNQENNKKTDDFYFTKKLMHQTKPSTYSQLDSPFNNRKIEVGRMSQYGNQIVNSTFSSEHSQKIDTQNNIQQRRHQYSNSQQQVYPTTPKNIHQRKMSQFVRTPQNQNGISQSYSLKNSQTPQNLQKQGTQLQQNYAYNNSNNQYQLGLQNNSRNLNFNTPFTRTLENDQFLQQEIVNLILSQPNNGSHIIDQIMNQVKNDNNHNALGISQLNQNGAQFSQSPILPFMKDLYNQQQSNRYN